MILPTCNFHSLGNSIYNSDRKGSIIALRQSFCTSQGQTTAISKSTFISKTHVLVTMPTYIYITLSGLCMGWLPPIQGAADETSCDAATKASERQGQQRQPCNFPAYDSTRTSCTRFGSFQYVYMSKEKRHADFCIC